MCVFLLHCVNDRRIVPSFLYLYTYYSNIDFEIIVFYNVISTINSYFKNISDNFYGLCRCFFFGLVFLLYNVEVIPVSTPHTHHGAVFHKNTEK